MSPQCRTKRWIADGSLILSSVISVMTEISAMTARMSRGQNPCGSMRITQAGPAVVAMPGERRQRPISTTAASWRAKKTRLVVPAGPGSDPASGKLRKYYYPRKSIVVRRMPVHWPQMPHAKAEKAETTAFRHQAVEFAFLPLDLVSKCDRLIRAYHGAIGCSRLADILWNEETRRFIVAHRHLRLALKKASMTRSAKVA